MQSRHRLYTSCKVVLKRKKIFDTCLEISYENKNLIVHMIELNGQWITKIIDHDSFYFMNLS